MSWSESPCAHRTAGRSLSTPRRLSRRGGIAIEFLREAGLIAVVICGGCWGVIHALGLSTRTATAVGELTSVRRLTVTETGEVWVVRTNNVISRYLEGAEEQLSSGWAGDFDLAVMATPDQSIAAVTRLDGVLEIRDQGEVVDQHTLDDERDFFTAVDVAQSGGLVVAVTRRGMLLVCRRTEDAWHGEFTKAGESLSNIRLSRDGSKAAWCERTNEVCVWDLQQNRPLARWQTPHAHLTRLAWSPDGSTLATVGSGGQLCAWNVLSGIDLWNKTAEDFDPVTVTFTNSGDQIITGGHESTLSAWDARSGELLGQQQTSHKSILAIDCGPHGGAVYTGGSEGRVDRWTLAQKRGAGAHSPITFTSTRFERRPSNSP